MRRIEVAELLAGRECRIPGCDNLLNSEDPTKGRYANMCKPCRAGDTVPARAYFAKLPGGRAFKDEERGPQLPLPPEPDELTPAEEEVLFALADGDSTHEIAAERGSLSRTVNGHIAAICAKLGARNRTHAVALAYHHGILIPRAR